MGPTPDTGTISSTPPSLLPPIQTIITGTETARAAFDSRLTGALRIHEQCIVVDLPLLETLPQHKTARLIAVVNNAAELYTATQHNPATLAIFALCDLKEGIRIRHAALHNLSAPGILLVRDGDRARDVFARVVRAWRVAEGEERAWGEPALVENADMIIPPAWDSEGKISAVVDAAGLNLDQVLQDSLWGTVVEGKELDLGDEEAVRKEAAAQRARAQNKARQWIKRLQLLENGSDRNPNNSTDGASKAASTEQQRPQSDFFQRLLAGTR